MVLAAAVVFVPPFRLYGYKPLETPRTTLVCAGAAVLAAGLAVHGGPWPPAPAYAAGVGVWLAAGAMAGRRPALHMERLVFQASAFFLGAWLAPAAGRTAPVLLAVAAAIAAAVHIGQVLADRRLWTAMASVAGNGNLLGTFLAPCVFYAALCPPPVASLLTASLLMTRCRASAVGLAAGVVVYPASAIPVAVGAGIYLCVLLLRQAMNGPRAADELSAWTRGASLGVRVGIWRCALKQILARPIAGGGPDSLRLTAARLAARLSPSPHPGSFRKAHNDVLQLTVDHGLAGLCGIAAMVAAAAGTGAQNGPMLAALASQLAAGCFFHTLYTPLGMITFAVTLGQLAAGGAPSPDRFTACTLAAAVVLLLWRVQGRLFVGHWCLGRFFNGGIDPADGVRKADIRPLRSAAALLPDDNTTRFHLAEAAALTGAPLACQQHLWHALENYDGECRPAVMLTRLAHHLGRSYPPDLAAAAVRSALDLEPHYARAEAERSELRAGLTPARRALLPPPVVQRIERNLR
jgi:hypothetical protein